MFESSVRQSAHTLRSVFHTSGAWCVEFGSAYFLYLCDKYTKEANGKAHSHIHICRLGARCHGGRGVYLL